MLYSCWLLTTIEARSFDIEILIHDNADVSAILPFLNRTIFYRYRYRVNLNVPNENYRYPLINSLCQLVLLSRVY